MSAKKTEKETKKKSSVKPKSTKKATKAKAVSKDEKLLKELTIQHAGLEDKHLRLKAEFDNFRRRKEREIEKMLQYEGEGIIKSFLPVLDDFERFLNAWDTHKDDSRESLKEGLELVQSKMYKFLENIEVESFGQVGDMLDADHHNAMMAKTEEGKHDEEILDVFEKGYIYKDRVLRHAKVIVNKI